MNSFTSFNKFISINQSLPTTDKQRQSYKQDARDDGEKAKREEMTALPAQTATTDMLMELLVLDCS